MHVIGQSHAIDERYDTDVRVDAPPIAPSLSRPSGAGYHAGWQRRAASRYVLVCGIASTAAFANHWAHGNRWRGRPWGCAEAEPWEF